MAFVVELRLNIQFYLTNILRRSLIELRNSFLTIKRKLLLTLAHFCGRHIMLCDKIGIPFLFFFYEEK